MCLYVQFLMSGGSYFYRTLTTSTIKAYLYAVGSLIALATGFDPRKLVATDNSFAPLMTALYKENERWEAQKDRREPWSPEMQRDLNQYVVDQNAPVDSKLAALSDWTCLGLVAGYRCSEYAQTDSPGRRLHNHARTRHDHSCVAFTLADFTFAHNKSDVPLSHIIAAPSVEAAVALVTSGTTRYTVQKNGVLNQKISYPVVPDTPDFCPVTRMIRIVRRFVNLCGVSMTMPLAVYRESLVWFATSSVRTFMRFSKPLPFDASS